MDGYGEDESGGSMMGSSRLPAISDGMERNARPSEPASSEEDLAESMESCAGGNVQRQFDALPALRDLAKGDEAEMRREMSREMGRGQERSRS